MQLGFGIRFDDLYEREGLMRLDEAFLRFLGEADTALHDRLLAARQNPAIKDESDLLVALAPQVEDFLPKLFGIEAQARALAEKHNELAPLYSMKRQFVQRRALHKVKDTAGVDADALEKQLFGGPFTELQFARQVSDWLQNEATHAAQLEAAARYAAWATTSSEGREKHRAGVLFKAPRKLDYMRLIPVHSEAKNGFPEHSSQHLRQRDGFKLTDGGTDLVGALDEANYCIWCHEQGKDSCSKGLKEKPPAGGFRKTVFGVALAGCPLEQKISEFHMVKARGEPLAALGIIAVDNPMLAATGHRICNDCMKACIYQKQEPVNIPQAETRTLKDVLELPWGFEIYSLLTRWNPFDIRRPYPKPATGKRILVVGLGPAGFTLAHHLMNDGHTVVAIDGLKIEPLEPSVSGVDPLGNRVPFEPIKEIRQLREDLDRRVMAGFGGVAEYGITVRWDKNFLKIIRLLLERRRQFAMFGGVRFGGTLSVEDAFAGGFDHVALCAGAGRPTVLEIPNGFARGVSRGAARAAEVLGRRDDRLPPAPGRQPFLYAQPRGSGEGAAGRHLICRRTQPDANRGRRARPRSRRQIRGGRKGDRAAGEIGPDRRRYPTEYGARAGGRGEPRARRKILSGLRRGGRAAQAGAPCGEAIASRRAAASAQ